MMLVKRIASILLILCLLITSITLGTPTVDAAQKATFSRHIGIVFDNSGSMYLDKKTDWCRATYAMEVFASMLNKGAFPSTPCIQSKLQANSTQWKSHSKLLIHRSLLKFERFTLPMQKEHLLKPLILRPME